MHEARDIVGRVGHTLADLGVQPAGDGPPPHTVGGIHEDVGSNGDVVGPDQSQRVIHLPEILVESRMPPFARIADERRKGRQADDAALRGAGANLIVGDVPGVLLQGPQIGMR